MKLRYASGVALCFVAITGCAPMQPKLQELQAPPDRIHQKGYSLVPPNEKGWLIAGRNETQVALVKAGTNADESIAIQAVTFQLPEFKSTEDFVRLVKEGQAHDTDPKRFLIKKHEVADDPKKEGNCARSHLLAEDNAAVKRSGKSGSMILAALTLTCAHPKNKSVGVNVSYSHRYYPGQEDAGFMEKATNVLDSVTFGEL